MMCKYCFSFLVVTVSLLTSPTNAAEPVVVGGATANGAKLTKADAARTREEGGRHTPFHNRYTPTKIEPRAGGGNIQPAGESAVGSTSLTPTADQRAQSSSAPAIPHRRD